MEKNITGSDVDLRPVQTLLETWYQEVTIDTSCADLCKKKSWEYITRADDDLVPIRRQAIF